jgi:large subunit ribosomal protein L30e
MDIQRSLRTVISTGKVLIGADQTEKSVRKGEAKLVIIASNSPASDDIRKAASEKSVTVYEYKGMGTQLGPACGKPFAISALAVLDAGESDILNLK